MQSSLWPHLRALLITAHILAVIAAAIPAPAGGMRRSAWKDPTVQGELQAWADRLGVEEKTLEDGLWEVAGEYMKTRQKILAPLRPYYRYLGTDQPWRMFVAPHRRPAKLHIDIERDGQWSPIYIARDPQHAWRGDLLDSARFRAALFRYSWKHYRSSFRQFASWIASAAAADFPSASRVRLRWYRYKTPSPAQVREDNIPTGAFEHALVFDLSERR